MTGQKASAEEIDRLIETGESEQIFQKAILEQGRGHVSLCLHTRRFFDSAAVSCDAEPILLSHVKFRSRHGAFCALTFSKWAIP